VRKEKILFSYSALDVIL